MSAIETPFGFLEVGKEGIGADAAQSGQAGSQPKSPAH
jgi:hypothetical protein